MIVLFGMCLAFNNNNVLKSSNSFFFILLNFSLFYYQLNSNYNISSQKLKLNGQFATIIIIVKQKNANESEIEKLR